MFCIGKGISLYEYSRTQRNLLFFSAFRIPALSLAHIVESDYPGAGWGRVAWKSEVVRNDYELRPWDRKETTL
ncbi:MAG TPA: hypothetical protein DHV65_02445, partial [Ktedonobacter sp.]|nr:hypothetical protein [Ktedonobacter sp.]